MKKTIVMDFDGVLHLYTSPWVNARTISDRPVPGAIPFLVSLLMDPRFEVAILSSRSHQLLGRFAMKAWLFRNLRAALFCNAGGWAYPIIRDLGDNAAPFEISVRDAARELMKRIRWPLFKPPAHMTIDDRALQFNGDWPEPDALSGFKPWNKRPPIENWPFLTRSYQTQVVGDYLTPATEEEPKQ